MNHVPEDKKDNFSILSQDRKVCIPDLHNESTRR